MQKRSFPVEIHHNPISLDPKWPVSGGRPYVQKDQPITFLHVHDCLELGYCYRGSGIFVIGEKVLPFQAGDVSFINRTEMHLARSAPGTVSEWTWIYLDPVRLIRDPAADLRNLDPTPLAGKGFENLLSAQGYPQIGRAVLRMVEELQTRAAGYRDAMAALTWELMTLMHRAFPRQRLGDRLPPPAYDRLAPALQFLTQGYAEPVDVGRLAERCSLSEPHFRRLFHAAIGRSPREYWLDLRIRMAASLLRSSPQSILQISHDVGFATVSSFNRQFLATFKTSPRTWRRGEL